MKKRMRCIIILGAIVTLAVVSIFQFAPGGLAQDIMDKAESLGQPPELAPKAPRPVALYEVRRRTAQQFREYPGIAGSRSEVELAFRVAGPLIAVNVAPGSVVSKGDPLMQIDPRDYEDNIAALEAQLAGAEAALAKARQDFERTKPLKRQKVVSQSDYDQAKSVYDSARATVQHIEAQLRKARHALEDTTLRAPFSGIVTAQLLENHEMVAAGQKALKMQDICEVEIHVNIPENELRHYDLRQEHVVQAVFPAFPNQVFNARLKEWSAEADPQTRTYEVTFVLQAPENVMLLPGMTAEVSWKGTAEQTPPLSIPASALASASSGESIVWVYDSPTGRAAPRSVTTGGLLEGSRMSILQGLQEGELIVAAGVDFITEDMPLRPLASQSQ